MSSDMVRLLKSYYVCEIADGTSTAATGTLLSFTVPAGKSAKLTAVVLDITGTAPTVVLQVVRGAAVIPVRSDTADYALYDSGITGIAGDVIRLEVTAGGAGSTCDALLCLEVK